MIVFCRDPLEPTRPDRAFGAEVAAVERLGLPYVLVDHDALVRGDEPGRIVRRAPDHPESRLAAYRGWMVTPSQYRVLYEALAARGVRLINDPDQYRHGHYLPESYPVIEGHTPRSVWLTGDLGIDRIMDALARIGDSPVIVKDFVKSRKHEWREACFIHSASDRQAVERVVGRFLFGGVPAIRPGDIPCEPSVVYPDGVPQDDAGRSSQRQPREVDGGNRGEGGLADRGSSARLRIRAGLAP